jgi:hypothetical protein
VVLINAVRQAGLLISLWRSSTAMPSTLGFVHEER